MDGQANEAERRATSAFDSTLVTCDGSPCYPQAAQGDCESCMSFDVGPQGSALRTVSGSVSLTILSLSKDLSNSTGSYWLRLGILLPHTGGGRDTIVNLRQEG